MKIYKETNDKLMLTETETANYIGLSRTYSRHDRMNGTIKGRIPGSSYYQMGRSIRYAKSDLDEWLKKFRVERY